MARITIEDCKEEVPDRFKLTVMGAWRARQIREGKGIEVRRDEHTDGVLALKEIAKGMINVEELEESFINSLRRHKKNPDEELENYNTQPLEANNDLCVDIFVGASHSDLDDPEDIFLV